MYPASTPTEYLQRIKPVTPTFSRRAHQALGMTAFICAVSHHIRSTTYVMRTACARVKTILPSPLSKAC